MIYDYFAVVSPDGIVRRQWRLSVPHDSVGPPNDGMAYHPIDAPIEWGAQPTSTSVLRWNNGNPDWEETAPVEQHRAAAIDAIDAAGEALRLAVISRMTQTPEYMRAEQHAREYRAAGYPEGEDAYVPPGVASWAMAKWREAWTARQAADDILATADRWYALLDEIRTLRLANKEDARHATTAGEVAAIVADMEADMQALALQMNTTTTE